MSDLEIRRFRGDGEAECENCVLLRPDSTRERARLHAKQRGHTVRFVIRDTTIYQPEGTS